MLLFLPYRNFSIQKSAMEHLHSSTGDEEKQTLSSWAQHLGVLGTGNLSHYSLYNKLNSITLNCFQLFSPFPPFNNSLIWNTCTSLILRMYWLLLTKGIWMFELGNSTVKQVTTALFSYLALLQKAFSHPETHAVLQLPLVIFVIESYVLVTASSEHTSWSFFALTMFAASSCREHPTSPSWVFRMCVKPKALRLWSLSVQVSLPPASTPSGGGLRTNLQL